MSYLSTIIDLIIPAQCLACRASGHYLCVSCCESLPPAESISHTLSAVYSYHHPIVKRAIKLLKYRQGRALARDLGAALYWHWRQLESKQDKLAQPWLVLPAPSSRARSRGYSQTILLARAFTAHNPTLLELREDILIKTRETASQVSLRTRSERLQNLQNTFALSDPGLVVGRSVLVIDDVITTSATMRECERVLLESEAREVRGLAVAHG